MRLHIKEPTKAVYAAISALAEAVDAHLAGDPDLASAQFRRANCPDTWLWLNEAWTKVVRNVVVMKPAGDTQPIPKEQRDPDRNIAAEIKKRVLARDGYQCRYCGLPVVHADIRKIAHRLYPDDVPWNPRVPAQQHSAFQVTWLQFDHVEPHSHGGRSSVENVVVSCALCNFGKDRFTLRQIDVQDPRLRDPVRSDFDGLERLRLSCASKFEEYSASYETKRIEAQTSAATPCLAVETFFFPGAKMSSGYINVPPINGKSRWFKIGEQVHGEYTNRNGIEGCLVRCDPGLLARRDIDPVAFRDI